MYGRFTFHSDKSDLQDNDDAEKTGICFPARSMCRPLIVFDVPESAHGTKQYTRSETHSNAIMTLKCACDYPKLLGFIVMKKPESTALTLSSFLTHFPVPPRHVFYDNACNLFSSAILRVPWLLHMTRMIVDRFHFVSHKCSAFRPVRLLFPCHTSHHNS